MKTIIIQGAMDVEIEYFLSNFQIIEEKKIKGYKFYISNNDDYKLIFSKTGIGVINATISSMIAINEFRPDIVINQGLAGAHIANLNIGDIVIGKECININSIETESKDYHQGSNALKWKFKNRKNSIKRTDEYLYNIAKTIPYNCGKVFYGILGSGDIFNRERDRIKYINKVQNTISEDMESIGVYTCCDLYNVPCIGMRIISNNELKNLEKLDINISFNLQRYICEYIKKVI